jgi:glutamate racemase
VGTEGTIFSEAYPDAILRMMPTARVFSRACPLFVPLVEEGKLTGLVAEAVVKEYLKPMLKDKIDTLLLGCTHYPLLKKTISKVVGPKVRIVDSADETARTLHRNLETYGVELSGKGGGKYYVSDLSRKFKVHAQRFLGRDIGPVEKVFIEKY